MLCERCDRPNADDAVFCSGCGNALAARCNGCDQPLPADAAFCPGCGRATTASQVAERSPRGWAERRRATTLFSDLAGYTALGEALDPEEVAEVMARIKSAASREIEACGGMVNQFVGDQVMALFGVPIAHEDDPVRAVRAALTIHDFMRELSAELEPRVGQHLAFHTGINTGLLVAQHQDQRDGVYAVTGDAVNTGARLAHVASAGEIVVGPETFRIIAPYFETVPLGPVELRGKTEPVEVHRVLGLLARSHFDAARRRGLSRFVGRRAEVDRFREMLADLERGKAGMLTVSGAPGVGKSRLFHEFEALVRAAGIDLLTARCESFGTVAPFSPFVQLLRERIGLSDDLPHEALVERALSYLEALGADLAPQLPVLLQLLSLRDARHPLPASLRGEALQEASFQALGQWLELETQRGPLAIFLEDWHWAELSSELALRHLMHELPRWPLLLCVNHRSHFRPDFVPDWSGGASTIELRAFDPEEAAELVDSLLADARPGPDQLREIWERTDGNPFFIEELCRDLDEARSAGAAPAERLPETVEAVVRARIDRLDPTSTRVLRVAAVLGPRFRRNILARLCEGEESLDETLAALERAELLVEVSGAEDGTHRFKHAITREVVYETLLRRDRRALHQQIGHVLEQAYPGDLLEAHFEELAHHFSLGDDPERAVAYLERAGDKAARAFAMPSALEHYARAVGLLRSLATSPERETQWMDLVFRWSQAGWWGPSRDQIEALEQARGIASRLGDRNRERLSVYYGGWLQHAMGDSRAAATSFRRCLDELEPGDDRLRARLYCDLGMNLANDSDYEGGLEYLRKGIELRKRAVPERWMTPPIAYALAFVAVIVADRGDFATFDREMANAVEIAERLGERTALSSINQMRIIGATYRADWRGGLAQGRYGCRLANAIGARTNHGMARTLEGWCLFRGEGDPRGIDAMREGIAEMEANGTRLGISLYYAYLAEALVRTGRPEAAAREVERALHRDTAGDRYGQAPAYRALALVACERGDAAGVERALERARRAGAEKQSARELALCDLAEAECLARLGENARAVDLAHRARPSLESMQLDWFAARAREIAETPLPTSL
jgi:class 3 adenylate cyclase/tetratricopeptide (TPR) repeat protein